jgi:hypothetical protein
VHAPEPFAGVSLVIPKGKNPGFSNTQLSAFWRKLWKYGDPYRRAEFVKGLTEEQYNWVKTLKIQDLPTYTPRPKPGPRRHHSTWPNGKSDARVDAIVNDVAGTSPQPRKIVHEGPWLAKLHPTRAGGKRYPSHAVIERRWSDGAIDYECADHCGFIRDDPISVSRHYGAAHTRGRGPNQDSKRNADTHVLDPNYEAGPPRGPHHEQRVMKLSVRLQRILRELDLRTNCDNPEWIAQRIAERLVPERDDVDPTTGQPLTAEQIIDRIRRMIDQGEYVQLRDQVTTLSAQNTELTKAVEEANARTQRAVDRWNALTSMIVEEKEE